MSGAPSPGFSKEDLYRPQGGDEQKGPSGPFFVIEGDRFPDISYLDVRPDHFIDDPSRVVEVTDDSRLRTALVTIASVIRPDFPEKADLYTDPEYREKQRKKMRTLTKAEVSLGGRKYPKRYIIKPEEVIDEMIDEMIDANDPEGQYIDQLNRELEGQEKILEKQLATFKEGFIAVVAYDDFKDRYNTAVKEKIAAAKALASFLSTV